MSVSSSSSSSGTISSSSRSTLTWWAIQLAGALDRKPLPDGHRQRAGEHPGEAGDQDGVAALRRPGHAHGDAQVRDEAVVGAQDGRPQLIAAAAAMAALDAGDRPARRRRRPAASSRKSRAWDRSSPGMRARASGCSSYIAWSEASRSAIVGTTRLGPKWRAMNIRTRARQAGDMRLVSTPAASSCAAPDVGVDRLDLDHAGVEVLEHPARFLLGQQRVQGDRVDLALEVLAVAGDIGLRGRRGGSRRDRRQGPRPSDWSGLGPARDRGSARPGSGLRLGTHALSVAQLRPDDNVGLRLRSQAPVGPGRPLAALGDQPLVRSRGQRPRHPGAGHPGAETVAQLGATLGAPDEDVRASAVRTEGVAGGRAEDGNAGDYVARHRQPHPIQAAALPARAWHRRTRARLGSCR